MKEDYFVLAENVLGLSTNTFGLKWSYGITPPVADQSAYEACALQMQFKVENFDFDGANSLGGKYHYFFGQPNADEIGYQRAFLGNSDLRLKIKGLVTGQPVITVNKPYFRYVNYRFMNLHSPGYILTDIASLLLLRQGFTPLHCSAFCYKDATVVVFAPPNTGKTLSSMMACLDHGADFIAEDLAITDGEMVFSVPWTSTFRYYDRVDQRRWAKFANNMTEKLPILELLPMVKPEPISNYLGGMGRMVSRSKATHLIILERDTTVSVQRETPAEAIRKIVNLNRYEFNYHKAPAIVAYEFFNPALNIEAAHQSEKARLRQLVETVGETLVVKTNNASDYTSLILNAIS